MPAPGETIERATLSRPLDVPMQPIRLTYTPDRADFAALYAAAPTPAALRIVFIGGVLAMSGGLGWLSENVSLFAALTAWSPPWGEVATVATMVLVMYGALMVLRRLSREIRAARTAAAAVPVTVAVDQDGVSVTEAGRMEACPWADVLAARLGRDHVVMVLATGRRLAIPRRAFADAAAMSAFALAAGERVAVESAREDGDATPNVAPEAVP